MEYSQSDIAETDEEPVATATEAPAGAVAVESTDEHSHNGPTADEVLPLTEWLHR